MARSQRQANELGKQKFNAIVLGDTGVGKTRLVETVPEEMKTLFINVSPIENGTISISHLPNVTIEDIETVEDMLGLIEDLKNHEKYKKYDVVYLDGLTALSKVSMAEANIHYGADKNKFKKFEVHADFLNYVLLQLKTIDKHIFITCMPDYEKESGKYNFAIDGQSFAKTLCGRVDAVLVMKKNKEDKRAILTRNDGTYPAKIRLPGNITVDKLIPADIAKLFKTIGYIE